MNKRTTTVMIIVIALVLTGVGVWFANRAERASTEEMVPESHSAEVAKPKESTPLAEAPASAGAREIAEAPKGEAPQKPAASESTPKKAAHHVHGRVLDVQGVAVSGLDLVGRGEKARPLARSAGDGSFDFDSQRNDLVLEVDSPQHATLRALVDGGSEVRDGLVVVAPVVRVSGFVVDPTGAGIEGARIETLAGNDVLVAFPLALDATMPVEPPEVKSGAGGAFTIERSIAVAHARLRASEDAHEEAELPSPLAPKDDVRFVLKAKKAAERFVTGVVVRADGSPATNARVHLGEVETHVDARGGFRFVPPQWLYESQKLVAVEAGSQAASILEYGKLLNSTRDAPAPVRLVLGPAPLAIEGHVVDEKHAAQKGWVVGLLHPTSVSVGRVPPITAEGLTVGEDKRFVTDDKGAFRIEGLLDREYDLFAYDPESLARVETKPVAAGKHDVEIVVTSDVFVENVHGRVVGKDGTPVTGADVSLGMVTARDEGATSWVSGTRTKTDANGMFTFAKAPRKFAQIDVDGEVVVPKTFPLDDVDVAQPLRLEVERRCHLRVEGLPKSETVRWISAVDGGGNQLSMMVFHASGWSATTRQQIAPGTDATLAYAVPESAVELWMYDKDDKVEAKRALRLVPGEVTVVKW